jgi:fatty acid desaturase
MTRMPPIEASPAAWRSLLEDLRPPRPALYLADAGGSALAGWAAFLAAGLLPAGPLAALAFLAGCLFNYRALAFIHEWNHQLGLRRLRHLWHALTGVPLLLPLLLYLPIHQGHHSARRYGTADDGEYEQFAGRPRWMTLRLMTLNLVLPLALVVRFGVLTPLGAVLPVVRQRVIPGFVHLSMRIPHVAPEITGSMRAEAIRIEWACFAWVMLLGVAMAAGAGPWVGLWYAQLVVIAMLNTLRAVCATHGYVEQPGGREALGQVADSINVTGGGWPTGWICPTGLRFHALHHLAPYLPYHALPEAHRRLMQALPADSAYHRATVPTLSEGWRRLLAGAAADAVAGGPAPEGR